jgi:hypothetical protein
MEDRLLQLFPDQVVQLKEYTSFINQPERIQISSQEDINDYDPTTLTTYYNFRVRLPRPALNVKSLQLARCSLPTAIPNIPDPETTWWYYALPPVSTGSIYEADPPVPPATQPTQGALAYTFDTLGNVYSPVGVLQPLIKVYFDSGNLVFSQIVNGEVVPLTNYTFDKTVAAAGNVLTPCSSGGDTDYFIEYGDPVPSILQPSYLRYVRLVPTNVAPELMDAFTGGFNRTFTDYDDLVGELNLSTTDDPLNGEPSNEEVGTFKFVADQISFRYDSRFNKIVFTGLDPFFRYCPAASDDPVWAAAAVELQTRDRANTRFLSALLGINQCIQPFQQYRDLNLRLGFTYATYPPGDNFRSMIRPIPPFIESVPSLGSFTEYDHVAPGYCDLVYSACCHVYTDITGGSTVDSILNKALLASVPLNTTNLGVGFHSMPLNNPLTKIATQLNEIYIEMRTDTGAPFFIGNNAIVSLELILTY